MKPVKSAVLSLLIACLPACSGQVVEFPLASGADASSDSGGDIAQDTAGDSTGGTDAGADAKADSGPDAIADTGSDVADAGSDVADAGSDVAADSTDADTGPDAIPDAGSDAATDASADADADATVDAPPTVTSTTPLDLATNVSIHVHPTATFSKAMDPATLSNLTFTLHQGLVDLPGAVTLDSVHLTATFTPTAALLTGKVYTASISTGAKGTAGTSLAVKSTWSFTTAACGQTLVTLASSGTFAVLGGSTVTSTGPSSVTGDLGVSPGTAVTGFPAGTVVGAKHAGDTIAAKAIADLTTAYNEAAGRTLCPVTVAGNLGGQTLPPGLYKSTSSLSISSGDLTLDAQGDGEAVWVFQMASTLTTTAGRKVILTGGAKASHVFWQVGTSATLGTTSAFQGTIMADQAITMNTGATLQGRVLARIGAINLDSNVIVVPAL
jgi:hypothetical protein